MWHLTSSFSLTCTLCLLRSYWALRPRTSSQETERLSIYVPRICAWVFVHQILFHLRLLRCTFFLIINFSYSFLLTWKGHSSYSAILEWDIEPLISPSPPVTDNHPPNPHRIPRSKGTEQLENSVPSVLDIAASILATLKDVDVGDQVVIVSCFTDFWQRRE